MRTGLVVLVAGALALAGCTAEQPRPRPEPAPAARDEAAVLAALRQVDACALLDPAAAGLPAFPASLAPRPLGPHRCELRSAPGGDTVSVRLGTELTAQDRLGDYYPQPIGGAKAYVERWANEQRTMCFLHLPVSHALSIRFAAFAGTTATRGELCAVVAAFGTAAARRLGDQETVRPGADRPMADRDPCALLAAGLGGGSAPRVDALGDHGVDGCRGEGVRLTLSYGDLGRGALRKILGRQVRVVAGADRCRIGWSEGPAPGGQQLVELSAPDCRSAEGIVTGILRAPAEGAPVEPWRPLLFRPDEPDLLVAGACGHFDDDPAHCAPYVEVPVPDGRTEALEVAGDLNVSCAIAVDAVRAQFGGELTPVTSDLAGCAFVEPTRTIQVRVRLDPDEPDRQGTPSEVAGLPAWASAEDEPAGARRRVDVALDRDATLSVTVYASPKPGATRTDPADPAVLARTEAVAADIVTTHLG